MDSDAESAPGSGWRPARAAAHSTDARAPRRRAGAAPDAARARLSRHNLERLFYTEVMMWPSVRVACVWIAQLPLRVEILRHPAWDGRPLVLGGAPGERKVVQLCSPEAEAAGVRPGLPLREVVPLCPEAMVLQPDPVRTAAVLDAVLSDLQRVSPLVEPADDGYFFVDLRGLEALYGELAALEAAIH